MLFIIGMITVFGCVALGYGAHGGSFAVLWQPFEVVIIVGAAIGAFIISNPGHMLKAVLGSLKYLFKGTPYHHEDYNQLLTFLFHICKIMKTKGMLEVEPALDNPHESELFTKYPKFIENEEGLTFFCDYMRLVTMGMENHYQLEDLMDKELDIVQHEGEQIAGAITNMGDGLPALGIVAAVLGVINTMGSITEPPEILGGLIGAALVGTFLGVLLAYGLVGPMGSLLSKYYAAKLEYLNVIKSAIITHVQGNAPQVTVEFARKVVPEHDRPTFQELDEMINAPTPE